MQKYLMILEVSQKQAFIFKSNKLRDNVQNSNLIEYVTSSAYFKNVVTEYSEEENMVYSGGGHTVLVFEKKEDALQFARKITFNVKKELPDIEYFVTINPLDETNPSKSLMDLSKKLEKKKSIRKTAFEQVKFGFGIKEKERRIHIQNFEQEKVTEERRGLYAEHELKKRGYHFVKELSELGVKENESNFIAIVHIDGNAMGERIQLLNEHTEQENGLKGLHWEQYRKRLREFSDEIDNDFKTAFSKMLLSVADNIEHYGLDQKLELKNKNFPIRRVITAGDDICFISEGRIGIEAAAIFLEELSKLKNKVDQKEYSACAGISIIHSKYPFYKAYKLAEELCSNTKKEMAQQYNTRNISALDWHIEFGELKESMADIKEQYKTIDGKHLQLRPYGIYHGDKKERIGGIRSYQEFCNYMERLIQAEDRVARSKLKELRGIFKQGEQISKNFIYASHLEEIIDYRNKTLYEQIPKQKDVLKGIEQYEDKKLKMEHIFYNIVELYEGEVETSDFRNLYFDGIEVMDCFLALKRGGEERC